MPDIAEFFNYKICLPLEHFVKDAYRLEARDFLEKYSSWIRLSWIRKRVVAGVNKFLNKRIDLLTQQDMERLKAGLRGLEERLSQTTFFYTRTVRELKGRVSSLEQERDGLQARVIALEEESLAGKERISNTEARYREMEGLLSRAKEMAKSAIGEKTLAEKELAGVRKDYKSALTTLNMLKHNSRNISCITLARIAEAEERRGVVAGVVDHNDNLFFINSMYEKKFGRKLEEGMKYQLALAEETDITSILGVTEYFKKPAIQLAKAEVIGRGGRRYKAEILKIPVMIEQKRFKVNADCQKQQGYEAVHLATLFYVFERGYVKLLGEFFHLSRGHVEDLGEYIRQYRKRRAAGEAEPGREI